MSDGSQKAKKPLRVAVTGGSGRIGSEVVRQLVKRGHSVLSLDRKVSNIEGAKFVYIDLTKRELVQPVFEQCDAVAHLGELPNVTASFSPEHVFYHNTNVGAVVLQTCADLKIPRVIYTSTAQVYGCWGTNMVPPERVPMDETLPLKPQNAYAMGKVANEGYARMLAQYAGLSVAAFRFPWVMDWYFTGPDAEAQRNTLERAKGHSEGFATYVHVTDAARAFVLAIENPRPGFDDYHFSAADVFSAVPIRERMLKHNPGWPALPADWPAFKSPMSTEKAKAHFGWAPTWSVHETYRKLFGKELA